MLTQKLGARFLHVFVPALMLFTGVETPAETGTNKPVSEAVASFFIQDFNWKEDAGRGVTVEESGPLFGISLDGSTAFSSPWKLHFRAQLYVGEVDYDGFIISIDGETTPYESDTFYAGTVGDLDASFDVIPAEPLELRPFAGLGGRYWLRSLDDKNDFGYDEFWFTIYGRLGIRVQFNAKDNKEWFLVGSVIAPFYNYEWATDVPLANGDVELEPKEEIGFLAEAGLNTPGFTVAIFAEQLNFGESEPDDSGSFFQPESDMQLIGLRVGFPL